jgi:hypothetical protein
VGVQFDFDSAQRIAQAVRTVERGLGIPTKRTRRPRPIAGGGTIQIVRLIENVPPAKLFAVEDDFYERFRESVGGRVVNEVDEGELLNIGREIIDQYGDDPNSTPSNSFVDRFFGSGLAWLCDFEPGRNREALEQGAVGNVLVRFTEVVRVWNMHPRGYNTNDIGGAIGNEAGSLGGGYCNAMQGWDGELWLVQPDRRIMIYTEQGVTTALNAIAGQGALINEIVEWLDANSPDWRDVVGV